MKPPIDLKAERTRRTLEAIAERLRKNPELAERTQQHLSDNAGAEAMEKLLTLEDLAEYLSLTYQAAWRLTRPKYTKTPIPVIKLAGSKSVRIRPEDLEAWLDQYKRNALD
mgnify:CR=1 FL=1